MATVRSAINRAAGVSRVRYRTTGGKITNRAGKRADLRSAFGGVG